MSVARRSYDSPVRRAQKARTRERILDAASGLAHELRSWDWGALTVPAVAERAGVGQRTVYRHFGTEQGLHAAVMQRLGEEAGIRYQGLRIDDVAEVGAAVVRSMASFAALPVVRPQGEFLEEHRRRQEALRAVVDEVAPAGTTPGQRETAAAALDALWLAPTYVQLAELWEAGEAATDVVAWLVGLVRDALAAGAVPALLEEP